MSKLKFDINPKYNNAAFADFVAQLPQIFEAGGETVYNKRNVIKVLDFNGEKLVVKRFKRLGLLKGLMYSFLRSSKAKRAYVNALELQKRGIDTPEALAFAEEWQCGRLVYGYYISKADFAAPIEERINCDDFDVQLAADFGAFIAHLHQKGILHHDLNSTNVLYHPQPDGSFAFSLIDINRMDFSAEGKMPSATNRYENMTRFSGRKLTFRAVAEAYVRAMGGNEQMLADILEVKRRHDMAFIRVYKFKLKIAEIFGKKS